MRYIKVRKEVAQYLRKTDSRNMLPDGNYVLWDRDVSPFGGSDAIDTIVPAIGGRLLSAQEFNAEVKGCTPIELPWPTDPRILPLLPERPQASEQEPAYGGQDNSGEETETEGGEQ